MENGVERRLSKLEGAVLVVQNQMHDIKSDTEEIIRHVKETNGRVGNLETWQNRVIGGAVALLALVGAYGAVYGVIDTLR